MQVSVNHKTSPDPAHFSPKVPGGWCADFLRYCVLHFQASGGCGYRAPAKKDLF